ncbi:MAG: Holliday junction branch migration protein RuvA [Elusimicrobiota bacterium]
MIASLRGTILENDAGHVIIESNGVGYELVVNPSTAARLPGESHEAVLYVSESFGMYGGGTTLYGFASREDKQMFLCFKDLPSTGAKKALDHLEKASRSLPDFRRAIIDGDARILTAMFGFTRKTAERLISGLKDKLGAVSVAAGGGRIRHDAGRATAGPLSQALEALSALGYRPAETRSALDAVRHDLEGREAAVEEIVRMALRKL